MDGDIEMQLNPRWQFNVQTIKYNWPGAAICSIANLACRKTANTSGELLFDKWDIPVRLRNIISLPWNMCRSIFNYQFSHLEKTGDK